MSGRIDNQTRADRQHARAHREIDKTAAKIKQEIERLLDRTAQLDWVARDNVVGHLFFALVDRYDITKYLDSMSFPGRSHLRLSNAMHMIIAMLRWRIADEPQYGYLKTALQTVAWRD